MANAASRSDPSPFPDQRAAAKQVRLQTQAVKSLHVLLGINPAELQRGWKEIELLGHHLSITD